MNLSQSSPTRRFLGALSALVLLALFVGIAFTLQTSQAPQNFLAQTPDTSAPGPSASAPDGPGLFSVPGMPGGPGSAPPRPGAAPAGQLPPMTGQVLPGKGTHGQMAQGQLPSAPMPAQMKGNPKLAALFQKGVEAQTKGDFAGAAATYREVLRAQPDALPAHLNLAIVLLQQKNPQRAVWHLKKAVSLAPKSPQPRVVLAQAYLQLKQPREAYEQWTQIAAMKLPDDGQAAFTAGAIAFEQLKKPEDAERWLRQANQQSKGGDPRTSMLLGEVLTAQKKHSEASEVLEPLAKKFPQVTQIQTSLADAQWQSGEQDKAIATLRAAEKSTPASTNNGLTLGQVRVMLGRALAQQKEYAQATAMLKSALETLPKTAPTIPLAKSLLAQTFAAQAQAEEKRGNLAQAVSSWNEAATLFPDNPTAYIQRGRLLDKQGKDNEALEQYNRALKMVPRDPGVIVAAAQLEEKTGDANRALTHWKTIIETHPEYSPAYFNLARLGAKQKQLTSQMDYLETRLSKNPNLRAPYDAILEVGHDAGRGELAREWVSQMAKKYPKVSAPRNAIIAFERRHPTAKPEAKSTPADNPTPKPTSTPKPPTELKPTPSPVPATAPKISQESPSLSDNQAPSPAPLVAPPENTQIPQSHKVILSRRIYISNDLGRKIKFHV